MSKKFGLRVSSLNLTSGKNFMVIRSVLCEILRGVDIPHMPVSYQKEQMPLTVNLTKPTIIIPIDPTPTNEIIHVSSDF